jgi:hypothetical protein
MLTDEAARQIINAYAGDIGRDPQAAMLLLVRLGYAQALKDAAEVCEAKALRCEKEAQAAIDSGEFDDVSAIRSTAWQISVCAAAILALGKE